jgi:hypothetical protein
MNRSTTRFDFSSGVSMFGVISPTERESLQPKNRERTVVAKKGDLV